MLHTKNAPARRVVLVHWKNKTSDAFDVFSNLRNFCLAYPAYSYNTLNNYLSKQKIAYENEEVRIERKNIISTIAQPAFKLFPVVRKAKLSDINEEQEDAAYWASKSAAERIAATTFLVAQRLQPLQRMDKSVVKKLKLLTAKTKKK
jgi:hypothetical protein